MIFNSFNFLIFFLIVFFLYYFVAKKSFRLQNALLLIASYIFYGIADWKMIPLLLSVIVVFYFLGIAIQKSAVKKASLLTTLGIVMGIGLLFYFKYLNFFIESFIQLFSNSGISANWDTLHIILPVGISFFTFRLLSYIIEINRGKIESEKDFIVFATYVAFFPTILSGPIDRPNNFLPQLKIRREFNYELALDGVRQILWGIFKKIVVADTIANVVNEIWEYQGTFSSSSLVIGVALYAFQLYADFSGYSDMAIGLGKLLGIRVTKNFSYPFFARNIAEFWRSWHISLTSWLTDYVFLPLNIKFRNWGKWGSILAIIITFVIIGLWHGANWTFVIFGFYHGLLYIPLILSGNFSKKKILKSSSIGFPYFLDLIKMFFTFFLVAVSLLFVRAPDTLHAFQFIDKIFTKSIISIPKVIGYTNVEMLLSVLFIFLMLTYEWKNRDKEYGLELSNKKISIQYINYTFILFLIYFFGSADTSAFIYFKF